MAIILLLMHPAPRLAYPRCLGNPQVDHQFQGPQKDAQKKKIFGYAPPKEVRPRKDATPMRLHSKKTLNDSFHNAGPK
jgi:hypothetical protein